VDQVADVLTSIRSINKTDSSYLVSQFGSFQQLVGASVEELSLCNGIGEKKVMRLYDAFNKPFNKKRRKEEKKSFKNDSEKQEGGEGVL